MRSAALRLPILQRPPPAEASPPSPTPDWHRFDVDGVPFVLVADGSRVYELSPGLAAQLDRSPARNAELEALGIPAMRAIDNAVPRSLPLRSISLAVAQRCNLGCSYCYAEGGDFGAPPQNMSIELARAAVDRLLDGSAPGTRVQLAFLGGEPLLNRAVVVAATEYAANLAAARGVGLGLSITTNGTLLNKSDAAFFERYGFAVTVSVDGAGTVHDRLRPFKGGRGSYATVMARVRPLLELQRAMQVTARVTVTPENLDLPATLDGLLQEGFFSVGFSPMLSSPTGRHQMSAHDLSQMLEQMKACGLAFEREVQAGRRYAFSNMETALAELHRGTHRPYPCGAGAGYFGVSASGELHACHRFVQDAGRAFGSVQQGVDELKQQAWLSERHVHKQEPCRSCWARYLCGGGCHHEVLSRGRPACDYIRGWLEYCLSAYARLLREQPSYFARSERDSLTVEGPSTTS
jgi:uncharacterized protein